ncbi:MAG: lysophospholipid acyltransferase family protein [Planctomycetota bacterium]|nr:lysophospholipid acyltransferase family protein [Planctomycetota bacterium]
MAEPLRRTLRSHLLGAITRSGSVLPAHVLGLGLRTAAALVRRGGLGDRARDNLKIAFGQDLSHHEREAILRASFSHSARVFQEWMRLARGAPPSGPRSHKGLWIERAVAVDDSIEHLERVMSEGRGAILVSAHLGNWELGPARLRRLGFEGQAVGLERKRDSSSKWITRMRRSYGLESLAQDSPPRRLLEVLQRGEILGLVCDLEVRRLAGLHVPFFDRPALTMSAPAALARAHKTPLIPMRCVARGTGYALLFEEPLVLDPDAPRSEATMDLLQRMNGVFENWIRQDPEQWAWHQHRWRTPPEQGPTAPLASRSLASDALSGPPRA